MADGGGRVEPEPGDAVTRDWEEHAQDERLGPDHADASYGGPRTSWKTEFQSPDA